MNDQPDPQNDTPAASTKGNKVSVTVLSIALVLAAALVAGIYYWQQDRASSLRQQVNKYEQLLAMPNQACVGVSKASDNDVVLRSVELSATSQLYENDPDSKVAAFRCTIGQNTKDLVKGQDVAEVDSKGYELGAEVIYFDTAAAAKKYANDKVNPLRFWGLDQQGQQEGIPQTSKFTSNIYGSTLYFDSYTVKDKALLRVSLPCEFSAQFTDVERKCTGQEADTSIAYYTIKSFSDSVEQLKF